MSLLSDILYSAPVVDRRTGLLTRPFAQWLAALLERAGNSGEVWTNRDLEAAVQDLLVQVLFVSPLDAPPGEPDAFTPPLTPDRPDVDPFTAPGLALPEAPSEGSLAGMLAQIAALTDAGPALELATQASLALLQQALLDLDTAAAWAPPPAALERPLYFGAPPIGVITAAGAGANATITIGGNDTRGVLTLLTSVLDTPLAASDIATITFARPWGRQAPSVLLMPADDNAWQLAYGTVLLRQIDTTRALFKLRSGVTPLPALTALQYQWSYHVLG